MPVFDAIKSAVLRATGAKITEAFSSTDQIGMEMVDLVNEVATEIAKSHDWGQLTKVATINGTGTEAYSLPADYDRMSMLSDVDAPGTWFWGYERFTSASEWQRYRNGGLNIDRDGGYIILGDQIHFYPGPGNDATFTYISSQFAQNESGTAKAEFTQDNDEFVLEDRLLTLGLIATWKAQKGLEYSQDFANYQSALAQAQGRDRGAYVLRAPRKNHYSISGAVRTGLGGPVGSPNYGNASNTDYVAIYEANK